MKFILRLLPLLLLTVGATGIILFQLQTTAAPANSSKNRDPNATAGQYEGKSTSAIQAELDRTVQEGMFNISINPVIHLSSGKDEAELRIENIPANHHLMGVAITRNDTGEVLYRSGLIEPGYHIQTAPLDVVLSRGDYEATALFTAYDPATEQPAGQAAAKIMISVAG